MPIFPAQLNDRARQCFRVGDVDGETKVAVIGDFGSSGYSNAPVYSEVTLNSTTWTALPATPLSYRKTMAIQNYSGQSIRINSDNGAAGFFGALIKDNCERFYDVQASAIIYAKCETGTCIVGIEELG